MVKLLLEPPENKVLKELGVNTKAASVRHDIDVALDVLEKHGAKVDVNQVLKHLPDTVPLHKISKFLTIKLEEKVSKRNHTKILRNLLHAEHLQVQEQRIHAESKKIDIGEFDICKVCHKRFTSTGAFVRLPSGEVVHFKCQEKAY